MQRMQARKHHARRKPALRRDASNGPRQALLVQIEALGEKMVGAPGELHRSLADQIDGLNRQLMSTP